VELSSLDCAVGLGDRRLGQLAVGATDRGLITRVDVLIGTFIGVAREVERLVRAQHVADREAAKAQALPQERTQQRPTSIWMVAIVILAATLAASYWYPRNDTEPAMHKYTPGNGVGGEGRWRRGGGW
jgi:hypothetical protein